MASVVGTTGHHGVELNAAVVEAFTYVLGCGQHNGVFVHCLLGHVRVGRWHMLARCNAC